MGAAVVIVAAGRGLRASRGLAVPKQYVQLGGRAVLSHTLAVFCRHPAVTSIQVVIHPDDGEAYRACVSQLPFEDQRLLLAPVAGGESRQASVLAGLAALEQHGAELVLIHDAARPFVDPALIDRVLDALGTHVGAVPAIAVADALKRSDGGQRISETVARSGLWRAQTPQGFRFEAILAAHRASVVSGGGTETDDAETAALAGLDVVLVAGDPRNSKLTTAEDMTMAERLLGGAGLPDVRTGTGFDVHRFAEGDHVWLGGVRIPHTHRLDGHSDADVALHALTDALLGAIGDGDIGQHFPPSDDTWKGAASHLFLRDAAARVRAKGGRIGNVDLTILCEAPRIGPYREAMRVAIAEMLGIELARVGVKATTTEQLGFTGRREGIAAMASATVVLPGDLD